jgi:hypothetical protein
MAEGGKKDALFIGSNLLRHAEAVEPRSCFLFLLDGASNEQGAGRNLESVLPWGTVLHGSEHVVNLIFVKLAAIAEIDQLREDWGIVHDWFTTHQGPKAMLAYQSRKFNKGCLVMPHRFAGTRFAGLFYEMHKHLRLQLVYRATISSVEYVGRRFEGDVKALSILQGDETFKGTYIILRSVWPLMQLLRLVDSNTPTMALLYYAVIKTEKAIEASKAELDAFFDPRQDEYEEYVESVFTQIVAAVGAYSSELKHEWAMAGFLLNPNLIDEAKKSPSLGEIMTAFENVVRKIYHGAGGIDKILQNVHASLSDFQMRAGSYNRPFIWNDPKLTQAGQLHLWHEQYSKPYHAEFGRVGSVVTAQRTGAGGPERNWAHLEHIWDDHRVKLGSEKAEKQLFVYEGHRRQMALLSDDPDEMPLHLVWTKDEAEYDLGLSKWGVTIDIGGPPKIKFLCYMEDWEHGAIKHESAQNEFRLLNKYKGVIFFDDDDEIRYKIIETNVEWKKKEKGDKNTPCYCVLAKPVDAEDGDDSVLVCYHINAELISMIKDVRAKNAMALELQFEPN